MSAVHAAAVDYDGTLTTGGPPAATTLEAIGRARRRGVRVVLVTGRIVDELLGAWPDVFGWTDVVVGENGAVLALPDGTSHGLGLTVPGTLVDELDRRGIPTRSGQVIVATHVEWSAAVTSVLTGLAATFDLVVNRGELMIVPAGITKATGLQRALSVLGCSRHSTIAIGDAENDVPMLRTCEIGVAVANAVEEVRAAADVVTTAPDGHGVTEVLDGPIGRGTSGVRPRRWQLHIGHDPTGGTVTTSASPGTILITGPSGSGKSYAAGLLAEQLMELGYVVLVADPEGDYEELSEMPGVTACGGRRTVAAEEVLARIAAGQSVVADLSLHPDATARAVTGALLEGAITSRARCGSPHWIVVDEAHRWFGGDGPGTRLLRTGESGLILVTYRPERLDATVRAGVDLAVRLRPQPFGVGTVLPAGSTIGEDVVLAGRRTRHVRHWHKYSLTRLPRDRGFWFRTGEDQLDGIVACNLAEFHDAIGAAPVDVLRHHARGHDFSRWVDGVYRDHGLGQTIGEAESLIRRAHTPQEVAAGRHRIMAAVETRILG